MNSRTSASWAFGSNWEKSKLSPMQVDLFSWYGVGLGQSDSAPHAGTCSVGVELLEYIQKQDGGTTETVSELLGHMAAAAAVTPLGLLPYETASTLASMPSPEVGRGSAACSGSKSLRPATKPSPRGQTLHLILAEVPLEHVSRQAVGYTMPPPRAGGHIQRA